ncbi:hypothetical protein GCM10008921_25960 [Metaclostridioides mangenotii]
MNIFLDTNIIFNDPFLRRGKLSVLNELSMLDDSTIYLSKAVVAELKRGHLNFINENLEIVKRKSGNLNTNLFDKSKHIDVKVDLDYFNEQFDTRIESMVNQGMIKIVPYYLEVLDEIVRIDMYEVLPFVQKDHDDKVKKNQFVMQLFGILMLSI